LQRGEQLSVHVGVGIQATALIARMSSGSIGEKAARFFDEKNPWHVIPDVIALDQEGVNLATN
jgi:cytochrome b